MVLKSTHAPIWPFSRAETGGREAMGACERTARRLGVWATRRLENLVGRPSAAGDCAQRVLWVWPAIGCGGALSHERPLR